MTVTVGNTRLMTFDTALSKPCMLTFMTSLISVMSFGSSAVTNCAPEFAAALPAALWHCVARLHRFNFFEAEQRRLCAAPLASMCLVLHDALSAGCAGLEHARKGALAASCMTQPSSVQPTSGGHGSTATGTELHEIPLTT